MSFSAALAAVLGFEGGYINDPDDRGGETFRGISRKNNPRWPGWSLIDAAKAAGKTIDSFFAECPGMARLVAELYRREYYDPVARFTGCERPVDKMFEAGVNLGPAGAIKIAQRLVGARADGVIGPLTQAASATYFSRPGAEDIFIAEFCLRQLEHYLDIIIRDHSQLKFLKGWKKRAAFRPA